MVRTSMRVAALVAASALVLTACGGGGDEPAEDTGPDVIRLSLGEAVSLIPMNANESEGIEVISTLYRGLVRYDSTTGEPVNMIAESIETEDNVTWTIKLQDGWTFHNGEPVDAASFKRAWDWAAYGPNAAGNNYFFARIAGYDEMQGEKSKVKELSGVKVVDDLTLEVTMASPFSGFATMLGYAAFLPVAQACIDDLDACNKAPIGNGPYQIDGQWKPKSSISVDKWEDYPGPDAAKNDRVEWTVFADFDADWPDFLAGEFDVDTAPSTEWESARNDPDLSSRLVTQDGTSFAYMGFPVYNETWSNLDLRRAIMMAVDMEAVINVIGEGTVVAADGWVPASIFGGGTGACTDCVYNPEEAKRLLEAAGGWPQGKKLKLYMNTGHEDTYTAIGDSIKQTLGIDYTLVVLDWPDYLEKVFGQDVDGPFRLGWGPDYNLNENYLTPIYGDGPDGNAFGYHNEAFEEKIAEGDQAGTLEEAVEIYKEAEAMLAQDPPNRPLYFSVVNVFYSERVSEPVINPIHGLEIHLLEVVE